MGQHSSAVILARVSSKAQEDEGYSLDSQLKLLKGYCDNKGLRVVKTFKITETASKQQERKTFHELLAYISANEVYHLAVEKTDRFTRNLRDAVAIDDWLEADKNRMLHAVKENLLIHKEAKSDVKFMWNIHLAVANKYTNNLREEAMKGWAEKLAQGWLPSSPPIGYVTVVKNGKRIHVPDKATKASVRKAFEMYLDPNHSIATITEEMKKMGLGSRKGRPFVKSYVQKLLTNPFYIGINRFNGKDYPGAQEHLISKSLFDAVQQKMHKGCPNVYVKHNPKVVDLIHTP
jgi:site-specific DNA recombinase